MGSKKHKKHHKSEKKEKNHDAPERPEKRLKLVLKVGGSSASEHGDSPHIHSGSEQPSQPSQPSQPAVPVEEAEADVKPLPVEYERLAEKHKKAKKKKKKKSGEKEKHEKRHKHHHHHHSHDKKEKRKRDADDSSPDDADVLDEISEPSLKRVLFEEDLPERPFREPRACTLKFRQGKSSLQLLLDFLLKALEKKDPQQFFAWPVTDHIAPGYSSIISTPMDFSTMRQKIDNNEYPTLNDFKMDMKLLCDNCMIYNRPDTVYYKTAKKMLHVGLKMMTKEKLLQLRHTLPYMAEITRDELGFDLGITSDDCVAPEAEPIEVDENTPVKEEKRTPLIPNSKFEPYQDDLSPDEILAEAQKAAADAAAKLTLKRPNSKFGFLRQRHDGTTTLAILNPEEGRPQDGRVTLEMLMGKLTQGTGSLAGFREDKRNTAKPVNYVNYGPFSSYAPTYDSTFANLTKEESDLLYSAYGDDTGFQYAESILNFTKDSTYMTAIVDNLLDVLTNGEHSKAMKIIEEKRKTKESSQTKQDTVPNADRQNGKTSMVNRPAPQKASGPPKEMKAQSGNVTIDYESLRSLADLGIDVSFLDDIETSKDVKIEPRTDTVIQKKLDETSDLLTSLHQVQHDRLSLKPPSHLSHVMEPSASEIQLADKVSESLKDLAKQANPGAIASIVGLRKAMGISLEPFFSSDDPTSDGASPTRSPHIDVDASTREGHSSHSSPHMDHDGSATDLESELQEFLETGPSLHVTGSPSQVDDALDENLLV